MTHMSEVQYDSRIPKMWYTSDVHFGHKNILKFCRDTRRGKTIEEHDELMIEQWNSQVEPNDEVWHLGDFCFYKDIEQITKLLDRLHGRINLILGNHDLWVQKFHKEIQGYFRSIQHYKLQVLRFPYPDTPQTVKYKIALFHFPMELWERCSNQTIHLHGHCHGHLYKDEYRRMDVGIDGRPDNKMALYSLEEILEIMKTRRSKPEDGTTHVQEMVDLAQRRWKEEQDLLTMHFGEPNNAE